MLFLSAIQKEIEESYGASTGLDVLDFVIPRTDFRPLGSLVVSQASADDLDIALVLDRDIFAAYAASEMRAVTVSIEEVSHFVYLSFNHARGRNVTALEMEIQSEVDRILLAYHGKLEISTDVQTRMLEELYERSYPEARYEEARKAAARFVRSLSHGDPRAWTARERERLSQFFHSDLSTKLLLADRK